MSTLAICNDIINGTWPKPCIKLFLLLGHASGGHLVSNSHFFSDNVGCSSGESFEAPKQVGVGDANSEMLGLGAGTMARVGLRCGEEFEDATCAVDDKWPESVGIGVGIFARMVLSKAKPPSRGTALKVSRPSWGSGICPSWGGRLEFASMRAHKTTQKKLTSLLCRERAPRNHR